MGVLATLEKLRGFRVTEKHIKDGLQHVVRNTGLQGRWQVIGERPTVILDTAHNTEGLTLVLEQLRQLPHADFHFVLGFVKDKNLDGILPLFPKHARYYFSKADIPRGLDARILADKAHGFGLKGQVYPSVAGALQAARALASENDVIFVGGSTFTVADAL